MLNAYKDLKIWCWLSLIFGGITLGILFGIFFYDIFQYPYVFVLICSLGWAIICNSFFNFLAKKRINKLWSEVDNCQIKNFVREYEKICYETKGKNKMLLLDLCFGYEVLGESEKALDILLGISPDLIKRQFNVLSLGLYYNHFIAIYLDLKEVTKAQEYLALLKNTANDSSLSVQHRDRLLFLYKIQKAHLNMLCGNFDGAEELFQKEFSATKNLLDKVNFSHLLAEIFLHQSNLEKAVEQLNFVIKNGGDSVYVARAKEQLKKINLSEEF